jgi:hypothetical protein
VLPPQRLFGYSEVPSSIHPCWDGLVKEKVLSDRGLDIAIRDVRRIISHSCDGVFFLREILALAYSGELARRIGIVASLRSDVVVFRRLANFAPPLIQMN